MDMQCDYVATYIKCTDCPRSFLTRAVVTLHGKTALFENAKSTHSDDKRAPVNIQLPSVANKKKASENKHTEDLHSLSTVPCGTRCTGSSKKMDGI